MHMYVCMYVCMYVYMCIYKRIHVHIYSPIGTYTCVYVCLQGFALHVTVCTDVCTPTLHADISLCIFTFTYTFVQANDVITLRLHRHFIFCQVNDEVWLHTRKNIHSLLFLGLEHLHFNFSASLIMRRLGFTFESKYLVLTTT
jgi:hypothetical protein